jgi:hypothetical protein
MCHGQSLIHPNIPYRSAASRHAWRTNMPRPSLVVFSHLRWDFVYQRPQHVLSRMAASRPVLFVEEPVYADGPPRWELSSPAPGVTVCRPHTPVPTGGFSDEQEEFSRLWLSNSLPITPVTVMTSGSIPRWHSPWLQQFRNDIRLSSSLCRRSLWLAEVLDDRANSHSRADLTSVACTGV